MSGATTRNRAATLGVLAAVLVGTATSSSGASLPDREIRELDLAASANPSAAQPVVPDNASSADAVSGRRMVKSTVTATGSAICDGCDAASTALQVLYVSRGHVARLDNTAAAWTQSCNGCIATALSVQVVVLSGVETLVPNNRALAVNAACTSCQAGGAAFQVVVGSPRDDRTPQELMSALRGWVAEQSDELRASISHTPGATDRLARTKAERRAQRAANSALADLENLVTGNLDATTVSSDVELDL